MKKIVCLLLTVLVCASTALAAFAAEGDFVPSIGYKGAPEIVPVVDPDGKEAIMEVIGSDGANVSYVYEECLALTPVAEASDSDEIPDAAKELLLKVYEELSNGTMTIPYEKLNADVKQEQMVIRDLFEASWLCSDHPGEVSAKNVRTKVVFDLGIADSTKIFCFTYKNNEWNPIVSCKNIGDGKVECVFEDFCPIAFAVEQNTPPAQTGDIVGKNLPLWIAVMAVSASALVVVLILGSRKKSK